VATKETDTTPNFAKKRGPASRQENIEPLMKERGFKRFRGLLTCLVMGQDSWSWLIALRLGDWSSIYMLTHEESLMHRSPFWSSVFQEVASDVTTVTDLQDFVSPNLPSVVLMEGDASYI
jgi:hypothetical protein